VSAPTVRPPTSRPERPKPPVRRLWAASLGYYWRTNLAVVAGVATSVAVLAGALLVGESVRGSLRDLLAQRLGSTEYVVAADRFFREDLAAGLLSGLGTSAAAEVCPIIVLQGVVVLERTGQRAYGVNIYGVDQRFWRFHGRIDPAGQAGPTTAVGSGLAESLGVREGDDLLLRIETGRNVPRESLFGRREDIGRTVRLVGGRILPVDQLGQFSLQPNQGTIRALFVPLRRLQQVLEQPGRANAVLLASTAAAPVEQIRSALQASFTLEDAGVTLRPLPATNGVAVESARILIEDALATAVSEASIELGAPASGVFSYLANAIRARGHEIPYSVISAVDLGKRAPNTADPPAVEPIWLSQWAWRDLGVSEGDTVEVDYFHWQDEGNLVSRTARFRLRGRIAPERGVDATFAPSFPGVSEAVSIRAWAPPFPLDLGRIRPQDEDYWRRYRSTPKAAIGLAAGQKLWSSRFGRLSSVRIDGVAAERVAEAVRRHLNPEQAGFTITAVRQRGLEASQGSTDFGEYFVYFSVFLIGSALMLSALFFRLGIEQRLREVGTLLAVGIPMGAVRRIFLLEGAVLSVVGGVVGVLGAIAYGGVMVAGLRTWWIGAVGTRQLSLHLSAAACGLGAGGGVLISLVMIGWTLHGLRRHSARALLAGVRDTATNRRQGVRLLAIMSAVSCILAALLVVGSAAGRVSAVGAFFGAGGLILASMLCLVTVHLRRDVRHSISGHGWLALARLGGRNVTTRPDRSILCIALVASATFVIVSVEAFRKDAPGADVGHGSGTGGYALVAHSSLPIVADPNSVAGREALGIPAWEVPELAQVGFVPFRVSPGDDASCVNLYAPQEPRILGASRAFVAAGRFSFVASLASTAEERENPWRLLEAGPQDGVVPAIGDANSIQYILHRSLGDEVTVRGSNGAPVRLRLVGALRDSMLQGELIVADAQFLRAFPDVEGFRFFLLDVPPAFAGSLTGPLQDRLADWGFAVDRSIDVLAAYHRVENTYLSTFQSLGALGLVLGTIGLAVVLVRNVWERRKPLALLRAVGYRRSDLAFIIISENAMLMIAGLACGTISAIVAAAPALQARGVAFPVGMVLLLLATVLIVGLLSSLVAVAAAFRAPLLGALRSE